MTSELPEEWYYRRFQAVGRAQSRYFLLPVLVTAYTVGLRVSPRGTVSVSFLGLEEVPKSVVVAAAMVVLNVLLLAFLGSLQAARVAYEDLLGRHTKTEQGLPMSLVDEHPNVADFLSYATYAHGKPTWLTPLGTPSYPVPVLGMVLWTIILWWQGVGASCLSPPWLAWVYRVDSVLVLALLGATVVFIRRRLEPFRKRTR